MCLYLNKCIYILYMYLYLNIYMHLYIHTLMYIYIYTYMNIDLLDPDPL